MYYGTLNKEELSYLQNCEASSVTGSAVNNFLRTDENAPVYLRTLKQLNIMKIYTEEFSIGILQITDLTLLELLGSFFITGSAVNNFLRTDKNAPVYLQTLKQLHKIKIYT